MRDTTGDRAEYLTDFPEECRELIRYSLVQIPPVYLVELLQRLKDGQEILLDGTVYSPSLGYG